MPQAAKSTQAGKSADLLIAECYTYDRKVRFHLDYDTLKEKLPLIGAKRVVLTHMSPEMLARTASIGEGDTLADGIAYLRECSEQAGREVPPCSR